MNTDEAVAVVNGSIFRPGWRWTARKPYADWSYDTRIIVEFELDTVDTSRPSRAGGYTVPRLLAWEKSYDVQDITTSDQLLHLLLKEVQETQEHEDREFLRTWSQAEGRWVAPFHPHTEEGKVMWMAISLLWLARQADRLRRKEKEPA